MARVITCEISPKPFSEACWEGPWEQVFQSPTRVIEQNFGQVWSGPCSSRGGIYPRENQTKMLALNSGVTEITNNEKEWKVNVDVTQFKAEEITVKTVEKRVVVEGKHCEREDEHGLIERQFKRTYMLPDDVDPGRVRSILSSDGILCVTAPKGPPETRVEIEMADDADPPC